MKIFIILLLTLCLLLCACGKQETPDIPETEPVETTPPTPITWMQPPVDRALTAQQYFVYNCESGEFVTISGELTEKIYPASITKLFTAYVAMQFLSPTEEIAAGNELELVIYNSSVAELKQGDKLSAERLVEAMLLPSGNDAAYVLATHVGRKLLGDTGASATAASSKFVEEMNRQAKLLGLENSNFANPTASTRTTTTPPSKISQCWVCWPWKIPRSASTPPPITTQ